MKVAGLVLCVVSVGLVGCVRSHRTPTAVYLTPAAAPPAVVVMPAPTSDRDAVRIYPASPAVVNPPSSPPPGVSAADVRLADSVSQLLKGNTSMADATRNVEVTIDNGTVILRGGVPSYHDRDEIVQRIRVLPGVSRVVDQLGVDVR